jgi:hypothetical protein
MDTTMKTWTVAVKDVSAEDNAAAIFAGLRAAAWGTYSAMRFAFKASSEGDLDEPQRAEWIKGAFAQVITFLPPNSPYKTALQKFLDENLADMIKG